jgi:hypothetical protein
MRFTHLCCLLTAICTAELNATVTTEPEVAPFNPFELRDKSERVPNEALTEGIQSADGRWFDVEVIIFERTNSKADREKFKQIIENKQPARYWDLQREILAPNLTSWLQKLPNCFKNIDPLSSSLSEDDYQINAATFFQQFSQYQQIISADWQFTDVFCLMPSESLSPFWRAYTDIHYLPAVQGKIYTDFNIKHLPEQQTGYDYDDFRYVYLLDKKNLKLTEQAKQIDRTWNHKVVLHTAWRQPGLAPSDAVPVYLRAGANFTDDFYYDGTQKINVENLKGEKRHKGDDVETESSDLESKLGSNIEANDNHTIALNVESSDDIFNAYRQSNVELFLERLENGAVVDPEKHELVLPKRDNLPLETWQIDGTISVKLDHYLYLEADLNFRKKETLKVDVDTVLLKENSNSEQLLNSGKSSEVLISAVKKEQPLNFESLQEQTANTELAPSIVEVEFLKNFPLKQERRSYSGDIHYLDHPKFGIIFQIRKYRH